MNSFQGMGNKDKKKFNLAMHHFRGVAIFLIVVLHIYGVQGTDAHFIKQFEAWKYIVCFSSSALFAFIAGYLSFLVEKKRFTELPFNLFVRQYLFKKLKNVYCPMLVVSIVIYIIYLATNDLRTMSPILGNDLGSTVYYLLWGGAQPLFWYIPFTLLCFAIVPYIFRLKPSFLIVSLCVVLVIPLFVQPSGLVFFKGINGLLNFVKIFLYYFPYFYLGVFYSKFEDKFKQKITKLFWFAVSVFLLVTIILVARSRLINLSFENFDIYSCTGYTLFYFQKLALIFILIVLLDKIKEKNYVLDCLARYAFCIYFLHTYLAAKVFIPGFYKLGLLYAQIIPGWLSVLLATISTLLTFLACIVIGKLIQMIFGKKSRMILGC